MYNKKICLNTTLTLMLVNSEENLKQTTTITTSVNDLYFTQ